MEWNMRCGLVRIGEIINHVSTKTRHEKRPLMLILPVESKRMVGRGIQALLHFFMTSNWDGYAFNK